MFTNSVVRYAGVMAKPEASVVDYVKASIGAGGKIRMGTNARIETGAEYLRFLGWRHATEEMRKKLAGPAVVSIIQDLWYGDQFAGPGKSNVENALRLLACYAAAPDDSEESFRAAFAAYKRGHDPRTPVTPAATAVMTTEAILAALASNPALLQALQGLQQVVQPQETLATTKAKAAERYRAAKAARENG